MILVLSNLSELNQQQNRFLLLLAIGLLSVTVVIFIMFELFIRGEARNIELSTNLQRMELESNFYTEIDVMYADMRTWRHDYKNNLTALRALAESKDTTKILAYIDSINKEPDRNLAGLHTGNIILDAVVSSKLWLAQSRNIEVNIQAVYPENNPIEDNDLCAIAGNLLDNAIEACERMIDADGKKFVSLSITVKGKNLILTIINSFNNELRRNGERYLTVKEGRFHGMGLAHVDAIVNKYQGRVIREHTHGVFETRVMLPLLPANNAN
jgi:sensor histidine kinase regulating citrate/malate metabolism